MPHEDSPKIVNPPKDDYKTPEPKLTVDKIVESVDREPKSMSALLSSIKSPKGTFRGSDLDKIKFLSNKRKKCLALTIEAKDAHYDE